MIDWNEVPVGQRVIYTTRSGKQRQGSVKEVMTVGSYNGETNFMIDVKLDGDSRERNYVPMDMLIIVPDELADTIKG